MSSLRANLSKGNHIDSIGWVAGHLKELLEKQGKEVFSTTVRMFLKLFHFVCCAFRYLIILYLRLIMSPTGMEDREAVIR